ncbi:MAG: hypothetical protein ACKPCM_02165, partial [Pseudanabaena sp.]
QAQEYEQKSNRLGFLKEMFDAIAHESPVDESESDNGLDGEDIEESREIFWSRDSSAALLEKPSVAIIEALRQMQFEDWVAPDSENWLEQISQLVGDLDLPMSSDQISSELKIFNLLPEFRSLERGGKQLVIPHKNVNEEREQLRLF